jgi:excisionase family DNA binding protein
VTARTALLTVAAVASELCVTPRWVHDRIAAGELRAIGRIGRGFRIRREWLDAFLAEREVHGAAATPAPVRPTPAPARTAPSRQRGAPTTGAPFRSLGEARAALLPQRGRGS